MRFRLKAGQHVQGKGSERRTYSRGDVVEDARDLEELFGSDKFEKLDESAYRGSTTPPKSQPSQSPNPKGLDGMSLAELKQVADDNEIDLKGLTKREDMVKRIKESLT